jgi:hypothetical protein
VLLTAVALALGLVGCVPALDHFRAYDVKPVPVSFKVQLSDQLDPHPKDGELSALVLFANPIRKVHGATSAGIKDGNRHLTWYALKQPQPEPRRTVRFRNQFGQHSVDIRDPRFLLVPAQKTSDPGSEFPKTLDHYKCYEIVTVNTAPALPVVTLGDQFDFSPNVQVGPPRFFCTPVRKVREGERPVGVQNAKDHLAVYDLPPKPVARDITAEDQFGKHELTVTRSVLLLVPTEKQVVVAHQN